MSIGKIVSSIVSAPKNICLRKLNGTFSRATKQDVFERSNELQRQVIASKILSRDSKFSIDSFNH